MFQAQVQEDLQSVALRVCNRNVSLDSYCSYNGALFCHNFPVLSILSCSLKFVYWIGSFCPF
jgi:hypothetical protein